MSNKKISWACGAILGFVFLVIPHFSNAQVEWYDVLIDENNTYYIETTGTTSIKYATGTAVIGYGDIYYYSTTSSSLSDEVLSSLYPLAGTSSPWTHQTNGSFVEPVNLTTLYGNCADSIQVELFVEASGWPSVPTGKYQMVICDHGEWSIMDEYIWQGYNSFDEIQIISPTENETVASTTVPIEVYYVNTNDYAGMGVSINNYDNFALVEYTVIDLSGYPTAGTISMNATLASSTTYYVTAYMLRTTDENDPIYVSDPVSESVLFHVIQSSNLYFDRTQGQYDDLTCSLSDLSGCIKKALWWAFVPKPSKIREGVNIWNSLMERAPFVYIAELTNGLTTIASYASSTPQNIGVTFAGYKNQSSTTITFISASSSIVTEKPLLGIVRTGVQVAIWLTVLLFFYRTAVNYFNPKEKV